MKAKTSLLNGFLITLSTLIASLLVSQGQSSSVVIAQQRRPPTDRALTVTRGPIASWPGTSKRFALVIGVDEYQDAQINKLEGATNDAKAIVEALIQYAGFPRDQVLLLTSDQPVERRPTRGNILRRLSNLRTAVPKDGLLLLAFAGHGIERDGQAYLLPSDAQVSGDVTLLEDTAINVEDMRKRIIQTGVGQVVMVLDACRNDPSAGRGDSDNPLTRRFTQAFNFEERNAEIQAFATLYATEVGHRAYEYTEKKKGYFTWALLEALKGGAADAKGEITLSGLVDYLQEIVPRRIRLDLGPGKVQKPFAVIQGYKANELVLAKTAAAENVSIADPASLDRDEWARVQTTGNAAGYLEYLKKYPNGVFAEEALWESIRNSKNPEDFKRYLKTYPDGKNARLAVMLGEDSLWERIQASKRPVDYQNYLKEYPSGRYAELAIRRTQPPPPPTAPSPTAPLKGVLIVLTNAPGSTVVINPRGSATTARRGQSDAKGKYRAELPQGVYDIEVSAPRYTSKRFDGVRLETDEVVRAELTPLVGSIQIGPVEPDATVLLNGQRPVNFNLKREDKLIELLDVPAGPHKLKIMQANQREWTKDIEVEGGETKYIPTEFTAAVANLLIKTEPEAEVYIDDNYGGRANEKGELKVANLAPGRHSVMVKKNEYQPVEKTQSFAVGASEMSLPLTRIVFSPEFVDDFTASTNAWNAPATWQGKPGSLRVRGKGVGLIKEAAWKDFRMEFDLSFVNGKGAVWIIRARDERTCYLFQLTGPNAETPNVFRNFLYQDGQTKLLKVFRVPEDLSIPGDKFHVIVEARGSEIKHSIRVKSNPRATQPQPFSLITDTVFSHGRIGFGSVEDEDFIINFVSVIPAR